MKKEEQWINYKTESNNATIAIRLQKIASKLRTCPEIFELIQDSFKWESQELGGELIKKIKEGESSVAWLINPLDCSVKDITVTMRDRMNAIMAGITGTKTLRAKITFIENGDEVTINVEEKFENWSEFFEETGNDGTALFFKNLENKYKIILREYLDVAKNCKKYPMVWYEANKKQVNSYLIKSFLKKEEVLALQKLVENAETPEKKKTIYDGKMKQHWIKFNATKFPFATIESVNYIKNNFKDNGNYTDAGKILSELESLVFDTNHTLTSI